MDDNSLSIKYKKKFIFDNIHKIDLHDHFINYININNCPHTDNSNGIFINLNKMENKTINDLYNMVKGYLINNSKLETELKKEIIKEELNTINKEKKNKSIQKNYQTITYNDFNTEESDIINQSKKYKID